METVREVLRRRDGMTNEEVDALFAEYRAELEEFRAGSYPSLFEYENLFRNWFGLEPDYLEDPEVGIF